MSQAKSTPVEPTVPGTELVQLLTEFPLAVEKRNIATELLAPFFAKADEWKDLIEAIVITDPSQTDKMELAKNGRLTLRRMRLEATGLVKSRREQVKAAMADFVLEDKLWLKAGQMIEAVFDNLEIKLKEKEEFKIRWEQEQIERLRITRIAELAEYKGMEIPGLGAMTEEQYQAYLTGVKATHAANVEFEKKEAERKVKDELRQSRIIQTSRLVDFISDYDKIDLGELNQVEYKALCDSACKRRDEHDAEQERIKQENERMKKEAEEKEAQIRKEREASEKAAAEAKAKADAELAEQKRIADEATAKAKAIQDAEDKRKQEAADKAEADRKATEKAAKAPEKKRLTDWVNAFELPPINGELSVEGNATAANISVRFNQFKEWARKQIV